MNVPIQAWALAVITQGAICAIIGYVVPGDTASKQAILSVALSLISGGFAKR